MTAERELHRLENEVKELRRQLAGRVLTCVHCGHEYPQGTPASGSEVLTEHIRQCPKHPMKLLSEQLEEVRETRNAMAHVIVEAGVVPGKDSTDCRCEECRHVAELMAEAGYLERVQDKWWKLT